MTIETENPTLSRARSRRALVPPAKPSAYRPRNSHRGSACREEGKRQRWSRMYVRLICQAKVPTNLLLGDYERPILSPATKQPGAEPPPT
jgi:hypothetical protein